MSDTDAFYKKGEIGVCGVNIYDGRFVWFEVLRPNSYGHVDTVYLDMFCLWQNSDWSFGLDIPLHPSRSLNMHYE